MPIGANYLYVYKKLISDLQNEVIEKALIGQKVSEGQSVSDKSTREAIEEIINELSEDFGTPITKYEPMSSLISSEVWNSFLRNVYVDLQALYAENRKLY
jgi:hypothetical protein